MSGGDALRKTLAELKAAASDFHDDWRVIGSAAARLSGADVGEVRDVDLVLSERDARALAARWTSRLAPPPPPHDHFRSNPFYRFDGPLTVEAMANFEIRIEDAWRPVEIRTGVLIDGVFVPDVAEQIALLRMMNREKDGPRIKALQALL